MIKAVLIDIDDTLLSFSGYVKQSMREGFQKFGLAEYRDFMYQTFQEINTQLWKQIEQGTLTLDGMREVRWNRIFKELGIDFDGPTFETYFRARLFDSAILEPGAEELLRYLSENYFLCAASNGPYDQQMNRLKLGGLYDYFDHFFISEAIGAQKPSREFFDYCVKTITEQERSALLPEEILIIGDSVSADISGGKQYGMKTCLYAADRADRSVPEADFVVKELAEIPQIFCT